MTNPTITIPADRPRNVLVVVSEPYRMERIGNDTLYFQKPDIRTVRLVGWVEIDEKLSAQDNLNYVLIDGTFIRRRDYSDYVAQLYRAKTLPESVAANLREIEVN